MTALNLAAKNGHLNICEYLVANNFDVNTKDLSIYY